MFETKMNEQYARPILVAQTFSKEPRHSGPRRTFGHSAMMSHRMLC